MDIGNFGLSKDDLKSLGYSFKSDRRDDPGADGGIPLTQAGAGEGRTWAWTMVILLLVAWGSGLGRRLPDPVPANHPDTVFSSARAMSQLVEIARRPHPPGSPEHARVREHLLERLRSLGLEPDVQTATFAAHQDGMATVGTLRHILARVPGTQPTGAVALMAPYDASPLSPGAGDGGTGVAAILEVVRALSYAAPLRNDLVIVLTDGAGVGLSGGRSSLDGHPWMSDVKRVISVEMHGVSGPAVTVSHEPRLEIPGPRPAASSLVRELPLSQSLGVEWPVSPVRGMQPLNLVSLGGRETHHQVIDEAIRVSESTLQHHGMQMLGMVRQLGRSDLGTTPQADAGGAEEAYFSVTLVGLVHHPLGWIGPLSVGLVLGWLLLGVLFWLRRGSAKALLSGVATAALCVGVSVAAGWGLLDMLRSFHPEYGHLETALFREGHHFLVLTALVAALVTGIYAVARRLFGPEELIVGALAVPLGTAVWMGFRAPSAAMALQWPLAVSLCAALLFVLSGIRMRRGTLAWFATMLLSTAILLIAVPNLELAASILTLREAPRIAGLICVGMLLLLPAMEWLLRPSRMWAHTAALLACVGLVVLGLPAVQGEEDHPLHSALIYLVDDTVAAPAVGARSAVIGADPAAARIRRVSGRWLLVPGTGEVWARSWVAAADPGPTDPGVLLLAQEDRWEVAGAGPDAELAPMAMTVAGGSVVGGQRLLELVVRPGLGGEIIGIHLPGGGVVTSVDGTSLESEATQPVTSVVHWGAPEGGTTTFGVGLGPDRETLEVLVLEHHLRPEALLGEGFFGRDGSLIADPATGSDRIIRRTRTVLSLPGAGTPSGTR